MKTKETILAGYIKPFKIKIVNLPDTIKATLIKFGNEKYFFRKDPIKMLKKTPAIDVKTNVITRINIAIKKDTEITKVDINKLMKIQSDFLKKILIEKQQEIKNSALNKWKQNQNN